MGVGKKASSSFLHFKQYKTYVLSDLELFPPKLVNMCHLQDVANNCGTLKRYVLFFLSDIIAEAMCLQ